MLYSSCTWYCKTRMVRFRLVGSCCFCLCKPVQAWVVNAQNNQGTVPKSLQLLSSWLQNNFSTVPRRLAVAAFRSAKHAHGTVPAGWQLCFCLCKAVHLWAVNALRILSELPESLGPSRKVHNQTVYSWICYCKASKVQFPTNCNCWVNNCKTTSVQRHMVYIFCIWNCKTRMVAAWYIPNPFAVVASAVCLYNCALNLWAANALKIWSQLT